MTSNRPKTPMCEQPRGAGQQNAATSAASRKPEASGPAISGAEGTEPRFWKVLTIRRELREGRYHVSAADLADALFSYAGISS